MANVFRRYGFKRDQSGDRTLQRGVLEGNVLIHLPGYRMETVRYSRTPKADEQRNADRNSLICVGEPGRKSDARRMPEE